MYRGLSVTSPRSTLRPASRFGSTPRRTVLIAAPACRRCAASPTGPETSSAPPRILFGTEEGELYALDAKTGTPVEEFGANGIVNLKTPEVMRGYTRMHYGLTSAPLVYEDLVITGSHIDDETGRKGPAGDVRAWDIRTGKLVWTFHTVPRPGETGTRDLGRRFLEGRRREGTSGPSLRSTRSAESSTCRWARSTTITMA